MRILQDYSFGSDNPWASGQDFRNTMDIYGFNYKPHLTASSTRPIRANRS